MRPASKTQTIADIALEAGVSTGTVSRALNDSPLISAETKARVREIAGKLNYQPNLTARNLRLQKSFTIGMVVWTNAETNYSVSDPFLLKVIGAISTELARHHYDLLLSPDSPGDGILGERHWRSGRVDGLLIIGQKMDMLHQINRAARHIPLVVLGPQAPGQAYCSVSVDNLAASRSAVDHLIAHGRSRIGMLGMAEICLEEKLRTQGYIEALQAAGRVVDPSLITHTDTTIQYGYLAMQSLLAHAPDIDGVFVQSDVMALGALEALRASGRQVPYDVSLIGFDNTELSSYCSPPLTTISQKISRGTAAFMVQNLMKLISGETAVSETIPAELIIRQSCGLHESSG